MGYKYAAVHNFVNIFGNRGKGGGKFNLLVGDTGKLGYLLRDICLWINKRLVFLHHLIIFNTNYTDFYNAIGKKASSGGFNINKGKFIQSHTAATIPQVMSTYDYSSKLSKAFNTMLPFKRTQTASYLSCLCDVTVALGLRH